ncbi:Rossmann-fold NAD(P)-binding domain-containing protein [Filimonas effusa]|uniref:Epimerase n=1 Tax=Filimonas effusa TaxID=2508721 RepID=A0A4Q1DF25_9BACT|nr:epimerase [Filimonas effusa]RXK87293.1 epimerase [Filimonas effusa]
MLGIIGCGWMGLRVARALKEDYVVRATVTTAAKVDALSREGIEGTVVQFPENCMEAYDPAWEYAPLADCLLITVPFSSRTPEALLLNRFGNLLHFTGPFHKQVFLTSSIGIYPRIAAEIEEEGLNDALLDPSILSVERLVKRYYPQVNILRLGGLMGDDRILSKYKITGLAEPVNHVHYKDVCRVIKCMMHEGVTGATYNVVAPLHPSKEEVVGSQRGLPGPFEAVSAGRVISSEKLVRELNFVFSYPDPRFFHL